MADRDEWFKAMKAKGHMPRLDEYDGGLDFFVLDEDCHNGPGCDACGWSCCWHCVGPETIPECTAVEPANTGAA